MMKKDEDIKKKVGAFRMTSALVDDIKYGALGSTTTPFHDGINGKTYFAWGISKPLNYSKHWFKLKDRIKMAWEVLTCHAFAVHFTEDEIDLGFVPTVVWRGFLNDKEKESFGI